MASAGAQRTPGTSLLLGLFVKVRSFSRRQDCTTVSAANGAFSFAVVKSLSSMKMAVRSAVTRVATDSQPSKGVLVLYSRPSSRRLRSTLVLSSLSSGRKAMLNPAIWFPVIFTFDSIALGLRSALSAGCVKIQRGRGTLSDCLTAVVVSMTLVSSL